MTGKSRPQSRARGCRLGFVGLVGDVLGPAGCSGGFVGLVGDVLGRAHAQY
jgi:rRNA processing protein Gar1